MGGCGREESFLFSSVSYCGLEGGGGSMLHTHHPAENSLRLGVPKGVDVRKRRLSMAAQHD